MKNIAVLKEILGKNRPRYQKHLVCSLFDLNEKTFKLAKVYENDFPIWHLEKLVGEKFYYSIDINGWPIIKDLNLQSPKLKSILVNYLMRQGKTSLNKYKCFDESCIDSKYTNSYKVIKDKQALEKIFAL